MEEDLEYSVLALTYQAVEGTTKRLEMTDHLVSLLMKTPSSLFGKVVYLTQGKVAADFQGKELGIAEKLALKAISEATGFSTDHTTSRMMELGDLGLVAEELVSKKKQQALFTERLMLFEVFDELRDIAQLSGSRSQDHKMKVMAKLLHNASPLEARYLVRTIAGKLRLGIADMTILDALAYRFNPRAQREVQAVVDRLTQHEGDDEQIFSQDIWPQFLESSERLPKLTTTPLYSCLELGEKLAKKQSKEKERVGDAWMPEVVDHLKALKSGVEESRQRIERAYNICSDLGLLGSILAKEGVSGLDDVGITVGVPIRAMLAERLPTLGEILEKMGGSCAFDYKYDGLRIQVHVSDGNISMFSRQLENITEQFPDLVTAVKDTFRGSSCIVEGECVPVDLNTGELLPFQMVSRRRGRIYDLDKAVDEFPVVLMLFDALYVNGTDLTLEPFPKRREWLEGLFETTDQVQYSTLMTTDTLSGAEEFFDSSLAAGCEGLIAKSTQDDSFYRAGARGWQWIKFKQDYSTQMTDTVDLVAIGAFSGKGKRAGKYGALLMASYDHESDCFESVCKLGSGFTDEHLSRLHPLLDEFLTDDVHSRVKSTMKADFWFVPTKVLEVLGSEISISPIHTCAFGEIREGTGLAIRFPRFTGRWREDKSPEQATTSSEIVNMYRAQKKSQNPSN